MKQPSDSAPLTRPVGHPLPASKRGGERSEQRPEGRVAERPRETDNASVSRCLAGSGGRRGERAGVRGGREARLLNDWQRGFPLVTAPYARIAEQLDADEAWVRGCIARWLEDGRVSRVGAVFRPGTIGVSTLAALAVPEGDVARVAAAVSARPEVNHNYEREHRVNLWFVVTATDAPALDAALAAIARETGYTPLSLPLVDDYWIDLGFDLECLPRGARIRLSQGPAPRVALSGTDRRVIAALEPGLPVVTKPYAAIARQAGVGEGDVLARLARWLDDGVIRRFGIVVRHRELGYTANAMAVWDVPDTDVDRIGEAVARETSVTLCYRRRRVPRDWPYNLYCMVHGHDREEVRRAIAGVAAWHGLGRFPSAILFARQRFKQRGARYWAAA
ncbi:MAG: Lrp/AsnC family transcriptional regulator [Burkholderiales bacterium]|nr:Lrp/AsnC family transcriptional regulator [Burkholderiales bacterium]